MRELHAAFAFVKGEYKAEHRSLTDEITQLTQIATETKMIVDELTALVAE